MFSFEDFIKYFSELEMMEKNMRDLYAEIQSHIKDPDLKREFKHLTEAEEKHENLVMELRKIAIKKSVPSR